MDTFEVIGAFVDRERVDPELLKQALASDEGRDYLVDLVALREVTAGQAPAADIVVKDRPGFSIRALALAAAIVVSVAGGYFAGRQQLPPVAGETATPVLIVDRPAPATVIPAAPAPTTTIQLERSPDGKESVGG